MIWKTLGLYRYDEYAMSSPNAMLVIDISTLWYVLKTLLLKISPFVSNLGYNIYVHLIQWDLFPNHMCNHIRESHCLWCNNLVHPCHKNYLRSFESIDSNYTSGSFAKLLCDLEKPPTYSSSSLFENARSTPLYGAVLNGEEKMYAWILYLESSSEPMIVKKSPPTMCVQLDSCTKDNKNIFVLAYWFFLVAKGTFKEVFVLFLLVGHTHDGFDASFGRWSM